ncbi:MAG TPA: hypothetical protein VIM77_01845 [Mucilaginibacter sp.]
MMYIAYSAIRQSTAGNSNETTGNTDDLPEAVLRYRGYQAACEKLNDEIEAIRQYLPGWTPAFR